MQADRIEGALRRMGPEDRALIELSVVRGVSDVDIASLLRTEPDTVRERREVALGELAAAAGDGSDEGRATAVGHLRDREAGPAAPAQGDTQEPAAKAAAEADEHRRGSRLIPAVLGGVAIAALVALVLALTGQDKGTGPAQPAKTARLEPLTAGSATGTARLVSRGDTTRLTLSVSGLPRPPRGGYVIWLYNSVSDARSLGGQMRGRFTTDSPLPAGYERFRFIDVSREPADGNRNHGGQSVLRLSVSTLAREPPTSR